MRYAPDQQEKTRARILEAAGKVFRRQGYHATGVDKVMEEAGLTAGGFYAHFDSKQALLVEALAHAGAEMGRRREAGLEDLPGREWIEAFLARYLDVSHRGRVEDGCPLVALLSEVSRAGEPVKQCFEALVRDLGERLSSHSRECRADDVEERVLAALAMCIGGLSLARSVRDEALAGRILGSCREQARAILCGESDHPDRSKPRRGRKPC
jgi:TetR/AcrR family transcriptional repressor of nem operon